MASRESMIATAVAKNLKRYLDVQRREQAFDLSYLNNPSVESLSKHKLLRESKLNNIDLEKLTKSTLLQHDIGKLSATKHLSEREQQAKLNLQREMSRHMSPNIVSPYIQPVANRPQSSKSSMGYRDELVKKKKKKRVLSAGRVGRGSYRITRNAPSQRITSSERERIINMTTKLLVATENIALPENRKQSRCSQTSSEESFPVIPEVRKVQRMRPNSAYSESESTNLEKKKSPKRIQTTISEKSLSSKTTNSEEHARVDNNYQVHKFDEKYLITRKVINYPSSILFEPSSSRASRTKSAASHSRKPKNIEFANSSEEELSDSLFETTPLNTPKRAWVDETSSNRSSEKRNVESLQVSSREDLLFIKEQLYPEERNMSTQTKRKDFPPKVVTYEVYVVTGNKLGAETKAKVKVNIFGEYGNTGDRLLMKSKVNNIPFQRNQTDVFDLDCVFLGKLSSVRIGHDGASVDDGWYLEKIIIANNHDSNAQEFLCKKWLSAREGDGQIVRDILLSGMMLSSQLPSVLSQNHSNTRRRASSSEDSRVSAKPTRHTSSSNKNNNSQKANGHLSSESSTKNSQKENKKSRMSSGSFTSSSDSEMEKEQRQIEKLKRREKRHSKEIPTDKPKANVGGIINKVGIRSRDNPATTPHKLMNGKTHKENIPPALKTDDIKSSNSSNGHENKNRVASTSQELTIKQSLEVQAVSPLVSSPGISGISSSSSTDSDEEEIKTQGKVTNQEGEDKVEFSNKDTIKKYLESHGSTTDDLYMAGFLAGIKANKIQKDEEAKEAKKKQEFEEKLKNGSTIHQACETGDLDRMKELVSLVPDLKNKADERGWAPVHISAAFGYLDLLKWLSVSDVNLTQQTPTGYTAIHLAAMNGHVNCIMILAAMGCPISCRTVDQFTPLHLAAMSGHIECVKWLLSNRAKIDVKDAAGRSPLILAEEYKHEECIKLLKIMKRELSRKDSAMAMLRDPLALRYNVDPNEFLLQARGADSGVGENEEEEWVSDTEGTSDVVGRGGDDRPESVRRTSVQVGRKDSVARKGTRHTSVASSGKGRRLSKQEMRQSNELEEKKKLYQQQIRKQVVRKTSFLDSIRAEIDDRDEMDNTL